MHVDQLTELYRQLKEQAEDINKVPLEKLHTALQSFENTYAQFEETLAVTKIEVIDGDSLLNEEKLSVEEDRNA